MSVFGLTLNSLLPSQSLFNEVQSVHNTGYVREDAASEGSHSTVSICKQFLAFCKEPDTPPFCMAAHEIFLFLTGRPT